MNSSFDPFLLALVALARENCANAATVKEFLC